jgi:hypothetical protein
MVRHPANVPIACQLPFGRAWLQSRIEVVPRKNIVADT